MTMAPDGGVTAHKNFITPHHIGKFTFDFINGHKILYLGFVNGRMKTTSYHTLLLEGIRDPQGGKNLSEASYQHPLETPFHNLYSKRLRLGCYIFFTQTNRGIN